MGLSAFCCTEEKQRNKEEQPVLGSLDVKGSPLRDRVPDLEVTEESTLFRKSN
jgi:hypothetical protein